MNLFQFRKVGLYKIVCPQNKKTYYGQTSCFLRRCYQHLELLEQRKHSCLELQKDVDPYGLDNFLFEIIKIEKKLATRRPLEIQWIQSTKEHLLYNPKNPVYIFQTKPRVAQRVKEFRCVLSQYR